MTIPELHVFYSIVADAASQSARFRDGVASGALDFAGVYGLRSWGRLSTDVSEYAADRSAMREAMRRVDERLWTPEVEPEDIDDTDLIHDARSGDEGFGFQERSVEPCWGLLPDAARVVVWMGGSLDEQLILAKLVAERPAGRDLPWVPQEPPVWRGETSTVPWTPAWLESVQARPLREDEAERRAALWRAATARTPEPLAELLSGMVDHDDPAPAQAARWLALRYPDPRTGLTRPEQVVLASVASGAATVGGMLGPALRRSWAWGASCDFEFLHAVLKLSDATYGPPLVQIGPAFDLGTPLSLTEVGARVHRGDASLVRSRVVDGWVGGVAQAGTVSDQWTFDGTTLRPAL